MRSVSRFVGGAAPVVRPLLSRAFATKVEKEYEYVVLGLGGLGSGAAYWLSRLAPGKNVLGIEQYELGHSHGGSQDHSRIIRMNYHNPQYVNFAKQAYTAWHEVEADSKEQLVYKTGGLDFASYNSVVDLALYMKSLSACGISFEHLNGADIRKRWPQFNVGDDVHGIHQRDGGIAAAAKGNAAHQNMARAKGATLLDRAPVTKITASSQTDGPLTIDFTVDGQKQQVRCNKLVIAAGSWTNNLLNHLGSHIPLVVTREQVMYYTPQRADWFDPSRFPVFLWLEEPCYYGFPIFGANAFKVSQDLGGYPTTPETRNYEPDMENVKKVEAWTRKMIPTAIGELQYVKTCLYDMTPDRDFVISSLPQHRNVFVAQGAAHAYKFASVIGKTLAELATTGKTDANIKGWNVDRPALQTKGENLKVAKHGAVEQK